MPSLFTPVPVLSLALLMLLMEAKHFTADYLLQTGWMAHGKMRDRDWVSPLAAHAGLHGLGTLLIALAVAPALWWLGPVDFAVHGAIDRGKALVNRRWHLDVTDPRFWWLVGLDQSLHHVTSIGLVVILALA